MQSIVDKNIRFIKNADDKIIAFTTVDDIDCKNILYSVDPVFAPQADVKSSKAFHYIPKSKKGIQKTFKTVSEFKISSKLFEILLANSNMPKEKFGVIRKDRKLTKKYFAIRNHATKKTNWAVHQCLVNADQYALKVAKRYQFYLREHVYTACFNNLRVAQLFESFPVLAYNIYIKPSQKHFILKQMVDDGCKLKHIAKEAGINISLKKIKPIAILNSNESTINILNKTNDILNSVPWQSMQQYRMFVILNDIHTYECNVDDVYRWMIKNAPFHKPMIELHGANDIVDYIEFNLTRPGDVEEYLRFDPNKSWDEINTLSRNWHRAQFTISRNHGEVAFVNFGVPFKKEGTVNGFEIKPIKNGIDLFNEATNMDHCVNQYVQKIIDGESYIYHVSHKNGEQATLELRKEYSQPFEQSLIGCDETSLEPTISIHQIRGKNNAEVSKPMRKAVYKWLKMDNGRQ